MKTLQVYPLDPAPRVAAAVEQAILDVFGRDRIPTGGIGILQGQYSFLELKRLYDGGVQAVLSMPGVVFTDIDEAANRLRVGVESPSTAAAVQRQLDARGIPRAVVTIEVTAPVELQEQLDDVVRPPLGGLRISNLKGELHTGVQCDSVGEGGGTGIRDQLSLHAHVQGGTESTPFSQPSPSDFVGIGDGRSALTRPRAAAHPEECAGSAIAHSSGIRRS